MTEEIDISKLHGTIKEYALMAERDSANSNGYGKLNTIQEINLFKEMIIKNGKQEDLLRQLPDIKGITIPIKDNKRNDLSSKQKNLNKRIIDLMKDKESNPEDMRALILEKQDLKNMIDKD